MTFHQSVDNVAYKPREWNMSMNRMVNRGLRPLDLQYGKKGTYRQ